MRSAGASSNLLTDTQERDLRDERYRLGRLNSIDKRAKNPPHATIADRTRRLGQISRQLKKHYTARDEMQAFERAS